MDNLSYADSQSSVFDPIRKCLNEFKAVKPIDFPLLMLYMFNDGIFKYRILKLNNYSVTGRS